MRLDIAVLLNRLFDQEMRLSVKNLKVLRNVIFGGFHLEASMEGARMVVHETWIEALLNMVEPKDAKDAQSLLGRIRTLWTQQGCDIWQKSEHTGPLRQLELEAFKHSLRKEIVVILIFLHESC